VLLPDRLAVVLMPDWLSIVLMRLLNVAAGSFAVVAVVPPLADCLRHNALRTGPARLADNVVRHVAQRFEAVQSDAARWERWSLTLGAVPTVSDRFEAQSLVAAALTHPVTVTARISEEQQVSLLAVCPKRGFEWSTIHWTPPYSSPFSLLLHLSVGAGRLWSGRRRKPTRATSWIL